MDKFRTQLLATTAMLALNGAAYAAEMPVKASPVAPLAPVTNWTGFYVGAQVGGAAFDPSCSTTSVNGSFGPCGPFFSGKGATEHNSSLSSTAFIGGAKIGYDWQFWSHAVVGVVGDFDWTNLNGTQQTILKAGVVTFSSSANEKIDWLASVRGRLGWAFDNVLFYATGGVAWTQIKTSASLTDPLSSAFSWAGQASSDKTGVVAGGGFEYRVTQNVSVVGELLWYDFGTTSVSALCSCNGLATTETTTFKSQDILTGTLGANWRF